MHRDHQQHTFSTFADSNFHRTIPRVPQNPNNEGAAPLPSGAHLLSLYNGNSSLIPSPLSSYHLQSSATHSEPPLAQHHAHRVHSSHGGAPLMSTAFSVPPFSRVPHDGAVIPTHPGAFSHNGATFLSLDHSCSPERPLSIDNVLQNLFRLWPWLSSIASDPRFMTKVATNNLQHSSTVGPPTDSTHHQVVSPLSFAINSEIFAPWQTSNAVDFVHAISANSILSGINRNSHEISQNMIIAIIPANLDMIHADNSVNSTHLHSEINRDFHEFRQSMIPADNSDKSTHLHSRITSNFPKFRHTMNCADFPHVNSVNSVSLPSGSINNMSHSADTSCARAFHSNMIQYAAAPFPFTPLILLLCTLMAFAMKFMLSPVLCYGSIHVCAAHVRDFWMVAKS